VRDVVYAVTSASVWDAMRTAVSAPGEPVRYSRAEAVYRLNKAQWRQAARDAQHSIGFLSRYTGVPYPYAHATAVEGDGLMGGGMEFPMLTLIGGFDDGSAADMYGVVSHELAHVWVPMIINTDERRYAWMDEGTTMFNEAQASRDFFPGTRSDSADFEGYLSFARTGEEGEMMRWSDFHYTGMQGGVASYPKPASVLAALRTMLGTDTFNRGYRNYLRTWRFKHPLPWDFFNAFNTAAGQDLSWFWRSWYYETWTLDQAVGSVTVTPRGTAIVVRDIGDVPMPARLTITLANGQTLKREVPVATWLGGVREATVTVPRGQSVTRVEIDAEKGFPDIDRRNNVWVKQ
jgi:aminopeptidase N